MKTERTYGQWMAGTTFKVGEEVWYFDGKKYPLKITILSVVGCDIYEIDLSTKWRKKIKAVHRFDLFKIPYDRLALMQEMHAQIERLKHSLKMFTEAAS